MNTIQPEIGTPRQNSFRVRKPEPTSSQMAMPDTTKLKGFKRCCCYAHIRRYFLETVPNGKGKDLTEPAVQGFLYCNKLFKYERSYRDIL